MTKKGLYLLLSFIVMISILNSCSSSNKTTYPPTARDMVNTILRKLTEGDISNILKYCDEDSAAYEHFNKITESSLINAFATSFASTPENQELYRNSDYIKNWFQVLTKNMYKDYQIIELALAVLIMTLLSSSLQQFSIICSMTSIINILI